MDIFKILQDELQIGYKQVEAAVRLIDEGNTIPFIARYRKEATGSLNDEVLRNLDERLRYLRNLEEKKNQVLSTIRDQEKLTPELEKQIQEAMTMVALEDLYRPYRPKRRTRAMIAKERGLEPLAELILNQQAKEPLEHVCAIIPAANNNARYFLFFILFLSPFFTILFFIDLITLSHLNKIVIIIPPFSSFCIFRISKKAIVVHFPKRL